MKLLKFKLDHITTSAGCIDMLWLAGKRYRIAHESLRKLRKDDDPWLIIILAKHGHFYAYSARQFGFATAKCGHVATRLSQMEHGQVLQEGTDGLNLIFPFWMFRKVAEIAKPRRRRRLSSENRKKIVAAGEATQLRPRNSGAGDQESA